MSDYALWVDFTRMLDDGRARTNLRHARPGFVPIAGHTPSWDARTHGPPWP